MKFIPKAQLVEGMAANPLDKAVAEDQDITALAQEGILTAAAAETDAINQYTQILDMVDKSEPWLGNLVKPTLEDIIAEEKKHFAQLSTVVSKLPAFEKEFEEGKEEAETGKDKSEENTEEESDETKEVKESVLEKSPESYTKFDLDIIINSILDKENIENKDQVLENLFDKYPTELYPEQVDELLSSLNFDSETLDRIEKEIVEKANIELNAENRRREDENDTIDWDIRTLKYLLEDEDDIHYLKHPEIRSKVEDIIYEYEQKLNGNI
jgi:rubrerythrin